MFYTQFTQPQQFFELWKKVVDGQVTRLEALQAQLAGAEEQGVARAGEAVDEAAKLMKASLGYTHELMSEWRKQSVELAKQATELMAPGA